MAVDRSDAGSLQTRFVGDISGDFLIRRYQRGYRWGTAEVRRLLDDIWSVAETKPYFLQPLVVKHQDADSWELVDGQQRLTTLYLILEYMVREGLQRDDPSYRITYETRPNSQEFLEAPVEAGADANIDFFHMFEAYTCIADWFEHHDRQTQFVANEFHGRLYKNVQVLWYEAPAHVDSTTLFTRLNVGRIPLTDAELVKALLLTQSRSDSGKTDRSLEIAAQWDGFERDLRSPEVWAFVTAEAEPEATHISLLLDTLAPVPSGGERPLFHTFETLRDDIEQDAQAFWNRVVDLHSLVLGWNENRNLFHKIGFLIADGAKFADLVALAQGKGASAFETLLDAEIRSRLNLSAAEVAELGFDRRGAKCQQVLLLMNVETIRKMKDSSERYSFRAHASGSWSLEHIHAQNAEALRTVDQWSAWLELHRDALEELPGLGAEKRAFLIAHIDEVLPAVTQQSFSELEPELRAFFPSGDADADMHSIANLALLDGRDNAALSNSVFEVKRRGIIRRDKEGSYIPICTRNVFLKYYTDASAQQIHFWGARDRSDYLEAIQAEIADYLKAEEPDS